MQEPVMKKLLLHWKKLQIKETADVNLDVSKKQNLLQNKYFLGEQFQGVYLTQREADCVLVLLQVKTIKKAAVHLNLSPRTVEFYLRNVRIKLGCKKKTELIRIIRNSSLGQCRGY
jgi:DNA-binding CsgD family transcriptional regulator